MPISVKCDECGKGLKAPDALAGKKAKCPQCGAVIPIPAAVSDAEEFDDGSEAETEASEDGRRACPMCGEMIVASAAKCRFCGEVLDPEMRKRGGPSSGRRGKGEAQDVRAIAKHQKGILVCILVQFIVLGAQIAAPPQVRPLFGLAFLAVSITSTVFVFMLAMKVYSTGVGIFVGILTLIPCVGLITLLVVNSKATNVLKDNGIKVGLLGAKMSDL